jgi:hypothetical protein
MLRRATVAATFILVVVALLTVASHDASAGSTLPDATKAGVADRLFRLDCGRSLANDESVWTPGENVGRIVEFSSTCWLVNHGSEWLLWDAGVPQSAHNDPRGWSTIPSLVSVANCKILRQNRRFQRSSAADFACRREARCLSFEDDSPPRRTACRCRPLPDGQRSWPSAGGSRLAELSRGAGDGSADELCGSRTATAGRAA